MEKRNRDLRINFQTLTPLWTGDAWGENTTIRPSSLMGSLRFWFEVICYFNGVTKESDYENGKLKDELKEKINNKKISDLFVKNGNDFSGVDKTLAEMGITLPSRIFGCTGWKGWIRIKEIDYDEHNFKNDLKGRIINEKNWFWGISQYKGNIGILFEVEEEILEPIFYPLLTFMEKYGFWGGKWNIGYGRLTVEKIEIKNNSDFEEINNWRNEEFVFSKFFRDEDNKFGDKNFNGFIQSASNFSDLTNKNNKILYKLENQITNNGFSPIIKELIKIKARERLNHKNSQNNNDLRHRLFGSVKSPPDKKELPQGTKIIPWIYEENGQKGGFISIAGILNLR